MKINIVIIKKVKKCEKRINVFVDHVPLWYNFLDYGRVFLVGKVLNMKSKIKIGIIFLIIIFSLFYTFNLIKVISYKDEPITVDYIDAIIVLGYTLEEGEYPSDFLVKRMETALDLYENGYSKNIIVSGGKGPRDKSEVGIEMYDWFLDNGVLEENLYLEIGASNTYENFAYSKKICIDNNFNSIIVVTNDFHMYRSLIISKEFFSNSYGRMSKLEMDMEKFFCILKEPLSIFKYYIFDKGTINI